MVWTCHWFPQLKSWIITPNAVLCWYDCLRLHALLIIVEIISLIPRHPNLFNCTREKRGSLAKPITCVTSGGTDFNIWALMRAGSSYSVQGARDRRLRSLVPRHPDLSCSWKIRVAGDKAMRALIPSTLYVIARARTREHPYIEVGSTWRHACDKFYQALPLFLCAIEKIREPGDKARKKLDNIIILAYRTEGCHDSVEWNGVVGCHAHQTCMHSGLICVAACLWLTELESWEPVWICLHLVKHNTDVYRRIRSDRQPYNCWWLAAKKS